MLGAATSSHAWTLTRSNAGKGTQPKSWLREMEEVQSPNTPLMSISEDLSQHTSLIPSIHPRERKLVFPVSFLPVHVCKKKTSPRRKLPDSTSDQCYHTWSTGALSLLLPRGPTAITAFSWKRLCSISENKITNFIPKISQQSSVSVPHLQLEESERQSLARSKNETGNTTAKPQALFLSSVYYTTLFSLSGHSRDGSPPSAYRLIYISDFFLMHLCM